MPDCLTIPEPVTFEEAIALTQTLLERMEQGSLTEREIEETLSALVHSENGARGFFVTYLTDDRSLADHPEPAVIRALQSSPAIVSELLVKNIAMSAAMAIVHRRNQNEAMAQSSDRVRSRTDHLIQHVQLIEITEKASKLHESATTGEGEYKAFLNRWNYDAEQRQVIQQTLAAIALS